MNEARNATSVICSAYDSFFEAEKKIADFLIEHKAEAAGMGRASQTSDATVSRFCRRCGFKGFQDLKLALTRELLEEEHREQEVTNEIDRHDLDQSLKNILANKVAELTETVRMMDTDNLEAILSLSMHGLYSWQRWAIRCRWRWTERSNSASLELRQWQKPSGKHRRLMRLIWGRRMWCL